MKQSLRRILLPLDPSSYCDAAMIQAGRIAKAHHARVVGMTVLDSPEIRSLVAPSQYSYWPMVDEVYQKQRKHAEERLHDVTDKFEHYCVEHGVSRSSSEEEGVPASLLLEAATLFDLLVVGLRTHFHFETRSEEGEMLDRLLKQSSTPVLAVTKEPAPLKKALIAYDGSASSARALRDFMLFAEPLGMEVSLFLADEDGGRRQFHSNKATDYLAEWGYDVREVIHYSGKALQALTEGVTKGYDLVVCGTHSKTSLRDVFAGSFTRKLIERGEQCLFLSH